MSRQFGSLNQQLSSQSRNVDGEVYDIIGEEKASLAWGNGGK